MLILALDSCGAACAVCLWQDGVVLAHARETMERGQDARLMPMIVDVMAQAGRDFAALDKIAVTRGPGSFTGVRVGLAAAIGLGLACNKPVVGIDRFTIYRALHTDAIEPLLVVIYSKRAELFCRFYLAQGAAHEPVLMTDEDIKIFAALYPDILITGDLATPEADELTMCATLAATADADDPAFLPRPLYLRAPDVTVAAVKAR